MMTIPNSIDLSQVPKWDNSHIYESFTDQKLMNDMENLSTRIEDFNQEFRPLQDLISTIEEGRFGQKERELALALCKKAILEEDKLFTEYQTMSSYAYCQLSVDSQHKEAKEVASKLSRTYGAYSKVIKPLFIFLARVDNAFIEELLCEDSLKPYEFRIKYKKEASPYLLTTNEEILVTGLSQDGLKAWGDLYNSIAGAMKVQVGEENLGLASAAGLTRGGNRQKRRDAYEGIQKSWRTHEEAASAILNAINGWRIEENEHRTKKKERHYLDTSCFENRISRDTLNALMETTFKNKAIGQQGLATMARIMEVEKLAPYDLLAPAPQVENKNEERLYSFDEAIELISESFSELCPEMGDFPRLMAKNKWIEARPSENRAQGAYCTKFARTREPRVFMTYEGTMGNVVTLAHELGHAYHNWIMRDLTQVETYYTMTTAETASIFAETLVSKNLLERAQSKQEKLNIMWQDAERASAMLNNIPARFEFERNLVKARMIKAQTPDEMRGMMKDAWAKWYGESISSYDEMFWASKLHFSIAGLSFYNYPYLFGYLFSLGIYAQKDNYGDKFKDLYHGILRDTGRMRVEDLVKKHLDKDITKPDFWQEGINLVKGQVDAFASEFGQ